MTSHRAKDLGYDEDDLGYSDEDYYEEEGAADAGDDVLTAEDAEQMRIGTASVREALGDELSGFITDNQIQEALWHYYYDVAKSVTYLKSEFVPCKLCQRKTESRTKNTQIKTRHKKDTPSNRNRKRHPSLMKPPRLLLRSP